MHLVAPALPARQFNDGQERFGWTPISPWMLRPAGLLGLSEINGAIDNLYTVVQHYMHLPGAWGHSVIAAQRQFTIDHAEPSLNLLLARYLGRPELDRLADRYRQGMQIAGGTLLSLEIAYPLYSGPTTAQSVGAGLTQATGPFVVVGASSMAGFGVSDLFKDIAGRVVGDISTVVGVLASGGYLAMTNGYSAYKHVSGLQAVHEHNNTIEGRRQGGAPEFLENGNRAAPGTLEADQLHEARKKGVYAAGGAMALAATAGVAGGNEALATLAATVTYSMLRDLLNTIVPMGALPRVAACYIAELVFQLQEQLLRSETVLGSNPPVSVQLSRLTA